MHNRARHAPVALAALAGLGTAGPRAVRAQPTAAAAACTPALEKDLTVTTRTDRQQYAVMSRMSRETYSLLKTDANAGLSLPIVKGLVEASGSYEDFQQRRAKFFQEVGYTSDQETEERELRLVTSPTAYAAWGKCMDAFAKTNDGLFAWKAADNRDVVVMEYAFRAPPGAGFSVTPVSAVTNGRVVGAPAGRLFPKGRKFGANERGTVQIQRVTGQPHMTVTLSAGGYTADPVESEWGTSNEQLVGSALLTINYPTTTDLSIGPASATVVTPNNHNNGCDGGECDPTGRWRASTSTVRVDVGGTNRTLQNLRLTCVGMPTPMRNELATKGPLAQQMFGAAYTHACEYSRVINSSIDAGGQSATAAFQTWTLPTEWRLSADVVQHIAGAKSETRTIALYQARSFVFAVPSAASSAVLIVSVAGQQEAVVPGQSSTQGLVTFVTKASIGGSGDTYYTYRVNAPPAVAANAMKYMNGLVAKAMTALKAPR